MPKLLDSVDPGGYVEPIEVAETDLQAVVNLLGLTDGRVAQDARDRIYSALEDFKTELTRTVRARTVGDDLRDLEDLVRIASPQAMTT